MYYIILIIKIYGALMTHKEIVLTLHISKFQLPLLVRLFVLKANV